MASIAILGCFDISRDIDGLYYGAHGDVAGATIGQQICLDYCNLGGRDDLPICL